MVMRIDIQGRNCEVTQRFRNYVEPRLDSLYRHFDRIQSVKIVLSHQRQWRVVEITVDADGLLLRAEERSDDERWGCGGRAPASSAGGAGNTERARKNLLAEVNAVGGSWI